MHNNGSAHSDDAQKSGAAQAGSAGQKRLSPAEQEAWRALMLMNHLLDEALDRQLQRDAGMPHAYYTVLVFLYEADGRSLRMSDLAATLRYSPSRLAHAIKSMERSGWVARSTSEVDRRVQMVSLTAEGLALIRRVAPLQIAEVRSKVLSRLEPAQLGQLTAICAAILEGLEPGASGGTTSA